MNLASLLLIGAVNAQDIGDTMFGLGGYHLTVAQELEGSDIVYTDSLEVQTLGYVNLFVNGGTVEYHDFLGETSFEVNVPLFLESEPVDYLKARALIQEFYDVDHLSLGKLTRKELRRGNDLFEKLLLDSLEGRSSGVHKTKPVSVEKLREGIEDYFARMEDYCPECRVDIPVKRRLHDIVEYVLEEGSLVDGVYLQGYDYGGSKVGIIVSEDLDWVKVTYDSNVYCDGGSVGHLDGQVDMVTSRNHLINSEFDSEMGKYVIAKPSNANQFVFDATVDILYSFLPFDKRITFEEWVAEQD